MVLIFQSFIIFSCSVVCYCRSGTGEKKSGRYEIKITYIEPCENRNGTNQMGFFNTKMSKINKTHTCISGFYALPYGLNDDMQESWEIFLKGSTGGWKRLLTFKNKKACSDKKRIFPEWFALLKKENSPCPIPRGNYTFECHDLTPWNFSTIKVMSYGEYRARINFYLKKENIGCTDFVASVIPLVD